MGKSALAPSTDTPAPWTGDLEFAIECRTAKNSASGRTHPVLIHDDWSVSTPHDIEAERVAVAFGGYSSCIDLVDRAVPAVRASVPLLLRTRRPAIRRDKRGGWRLPTGEPAHDACHLRRYRSIPHVVEHLRSAEHIAAVSDGAPDWQVAAVIQTLLADCAPDLGRAHPAAGRIREVGGLADLWAAGIHPGDILELAAPAVSVAHPLPVAYFLGVAYGGVDRDWLTDVLAYRPDPDTATWLAWVDPSPSPAAARDWGQWLTFGLPSSTTEFVIGEGIPADHVHDVANATGWSAAHTARMIAEWARSGCRPTADHFCELARRGLEFSAPSTGALHTLCADTEQLPLVDHEVTDRTELGVLLVVLGTRAEVVAALRRGARTVSDLSGAAPESGPA